MSNGKQVKMITVQLRKKCAEGTWCMGIFNWTLGAIECCPHLLLVSISARLTIQN